MSHSQARAHKSKLREILKSNRQQLSKEEYDSANRQINCKLALALDWSRIKKLHCYTPLNNNNEIDPMSFISSLKNIDITYGDNRKLADIPKEKYDAIIVPGLGFDREGNRIGYGGGWYDRFLAKQPQAIKIGLAYDESIIDAITPVDHDIPLDLIVTPTSINQTSRR